MEFVYFVWALLIGLIILGNPIVANQTQKQIDAISKNCSTNCR